MRKTAAYIISIIFLFSAGLAILHPSYHAIASWLSPLTGGFIYTILIVFTLLVADPFKYLTVGLVWISTGIIIGLISQKKLGSSIVAFFSWLSMIPTLVVAAFGVYTTLDSRGMFIIDSVDEIINIVPNIPSDLKFSSLFEIPIISELVLELMEVVPSIGENTDPMQLMISIAMPHATAFALKPILIIISAVVGSILGKLIFSRIDLNMLPMRKNTAALIILLVISQTTNPLTVIGQEPELDEQTIAFLEALGVNIEDLDLEALEEIGLTIEDIQTIAAMDPEDLNIETLTDMGIDREIAMGIVMGLSDEGPGSSEEPGFSLDFDLNFNDGIYVEVLGGFVEHQGRALTGELLVGNDIETVSSTASYTQDLAASAILTQKIFDPSILYTLPVEGIENYVQFTGLAPELVAVNVYVSDDKDGATAKSDALIDEYESLYGIQFSRVTSIQQTFTQDEGATMEIPPYVICVYYSINTLEETIPNILTGFENKEGLVSTIQEIIDGERHDAELYVTGQISPSYLEAFIPIPDVPASIQDHIENLFKETYYFASGVQVQNDAIPSSSGSTFDLKEALDIETPSYSPASDISLVAVARPNSTEPEPDLKVSTSLAQNSMELVFIEMYLRGMLNVELYGGSAPRSSDMIIDLLDYTPNEVTISKTSQPTNNGDSVTITVTNEGPQTLSDFNLKDSFPSKYDILDSGTSEVTWNRLAPGESFSVSYVTSYDHPGSYTDSPAILSYTKNESTKTSISNTLPVQTVNPNPFALLSKNYQTTFDLVDLVTGNGSLFQLIPLAFIAIIAAIDIFKIYRARSKVEPQVQEEPENSDTPIDEDTSEDPL